MALSAAPRSGASRDLPVALALAAYALVAVAAWIFLPPRGFWVNDQGIKYLQVEMINSSPEHSSEVRFRYSPQETGGILPYTREYLCRVRGKDYFILPDTFAQLAALVQRAGGEGAMRVLPLIAGLVGAFFWVLAGRAGSGRSARFLPLVILASPWMFYHWVLWEHTLALLAQALSLWLFLRGWKGHERWLLPASGVVLGLGAFLRLELLACAAATGVGFGFVYSDWRRPLRFALGVVLPSAIFLAVNAVNWGHPLGVHYLVNTGAPGANILGAHLGAARALLVGFPAQPWAATAALLGTAAFLAFSAEPRRDRAWLGWIAGLAGAVSVRWAFSHEADPFRALIDSGSLSALTPLLFLGLAVPLRWKGSRRQRALALSAILFFVLAAVTCPPTAARGIHWGPRMLLPGLVPLGLLAAERCALLWRLGRRCSRAGHSWLLPRLALLAVVALGLYDSTLSYSLLYRQSSHNAAVERYLETRSEPFIATNLWWVSEVYARTGTAHTYFFLARPEDYSVFRRFAREQRQGSYLLITDQKLEPRPEMEPLSIAGAPYRGTILDAYCYRVTAPPG